MDTQNLVDGLQAKRDQLFARLSEITRESQDIAKSLSGIHITLRSLDGRLDYPESVDEIIAAAIDHRPRATVKVDRREVFQLVGQILRSSDGPLTTEAFVKAIAERKGIPADDAASIKKLAQRVAQTLYAMRKSHAVNADQQPGRRAILWTAIRPQAAARG